MDGTCYWHGVDPDSFEDLQRNARPLLLAQRFDYLPPLTVSVRGSELAAIAGKVTFHDRSLAAVVSFSFPPKDTVTFSLASAHRQIEIGLSRCSTMLV